MPSTHVGTSGWQHNTFAGRFYPDDIAQDDWFDPEQHARIARAVAEKFERTVSRLVAFCRVHVVGAGAPVE